MLRLSDSGSVCPIYLRNWFVDKKLARYISSMLHMYAHFFSSSDLSDVIVHRT